MRVLIATDGEGGTTFLTNERKGPVTVVPSLEIDTRYVRGVFGPREMVTGLGRQRTAAEIVFQWASQPGRTPAEQELAARYLAQWQGGPQL
jgi:hypothetical protein